MATIAAGLNKRKFWISAILNSAIFNPLNYQTKFKLQPTAMLEYG